MSISRYTVEIDRSPEEVFAYLTDLKRHAEWSPKPYSVEAISDGPMRVGSRFRSVGWLPRRPQNENEIEVTALEPPSRFSFNAYDRGETFKNDFVLTARNGGTNVERIMDMPNPKGFVGVILPILFPLVVRRAIQKGMNLLKARVEGKPA